jgi:integrase
VVGGSLRGAVEGGRTARIRLHDLRHSYAVASLTANVHPKVVSERLGHATVALTLDVYSHVLPSLDEGGHSEGGRAHPGL